MPFLEQRGAPGIDGDSFDGVKRFQRIGGQVAEEPVGAQSAVEAAWLICALHTAVIQPRAK